jgi:hypothetical protein
MTRRTYLSRTVEMNLASHLRVRQILFRLLINSTKSDQLRTQVEGVTRRRGEGLAHAPHANDEAAHPGGEGPAAQQHRGVRRRGEPWRPGGGGGRGRREAEPEWESAVGVGGGIGGGD